MKKNKRVIILLSVLILGIGLSLAYFVGKTIFTGNGATTEGRTATVNGSTLDVKGTLEFDDPDIYPGHQSLSKIEVTATGDNEFIAYNLTWEGNNGLNTTLKYKVYKSKEKKEITLTCEKKKKVRNGIQYLNEECKSNIEEELGSPIKEGEIIKTEGETTKEIITDTEYITSTKDGEKLYYYIIVEYPNLTEEDNKNQNEDIGHNFDGRVYAEINNKRADINILGIYIKDEDTGEYKEAKEMPGSNYMIVESKCSNDAEAVTDLEDNTVKIKNLSLEGTSCDLYYDKYNLLKYLELSSKGKVGPITGPSCEGSKNGICYNSDKQNNNMNQNGIYEAEDDYGLSYVYRGRVNNNWVKFGKINADQGEDANKDIWWRIIRINGNETIRLIYAGIGKTAPATNTSATQIDTSAYNTFYNDNKYVGYMYGTESNGSASSEGTTGTTEASREESGKKPAHTNEYNSTIKDVLDKWYDTTNLETTGKVDEETGFCNDREPIASNHGSFGKNTYGKNLAGYAPAERVWQSESTNWNTKEQTPTLKCGTDTSRKYDLFTGINTEGITVNGKTIEGNKKLTKPVGLITMDEPMFI